MTPDKPKKQAFDTTGLPMEWTLADGTRVVLKNNGNVCVVDSISDLYPQVLCELIEVLRQIAAEIERRTGGKP